MQQQKTQLHLYFTVHYFIIILQPTQNRQFTVSCTGYERDSWPICLQMLFETFSQIHIWEGAGVKLAPTSAETRT